MDDELERFKREIDLAELASFYGYRLHGRPSRTSLKMKNEGSTIIVAVDDKDGHGVFFEVLGEAGGSVIDFVKWQKNCNLGYARKYLREYTGQHSFSFPTAQRGFKLVPIKRDRAKVIAEWEGLQPYKPGYLEGRGLSPDTIAQFAAHMRTGGAYNNTYFLHEDETGITGFEVKNRGGFTGFAGGGEKALFMCRIGEARDTEEQRIIIAESAIDAMSCYQLNPSNGIYLSIAGGLNDTQPELLRRTLAQFPHARIFIATDNDLPTKERPIPEGEHYYEVISKLCPPTATVIRARPQEPYKDWNDKLTGKPRQPKKGELSHVARIGETRSAVTEREHQH